MNEPQRKIDYLVTGAIPLFSGLLFLVLNQALGLPAVLNFSLLFLCQGALLMILGALSIYRSHAAVRPPRKKAAPEPEEKPDSAGDPEGAEPPEDGEKPVKRPKRRRKPEVRERNESLNSVNATVALFIALMLVVSYDILTPGSPAEPKAAPALIHMVLCVLIFILCACVEKWWAMKLQQNEDAAAVCSLMVLDKLAAAVLLADLILHFTGADRGAKYTGTLMILIWLYLTFSVLLSGVIKLVFHRTEMTFHLYVPLPFYRRGGGERQSLVDWLEANTGLSMRSLWSLNFLRVSLPACLLGGLLLLWLSTCVVQVEPYQKGALYRFGRLEAQDILEPGLHVKLPVPFETARVYDVTHPRTLYVGYEGSDEEGDNNLWTTSHTGEEHKMLLGGGRELVSINLKVHYRISDLYSYLTNYAQPDKVLQAKGYEIIMHNTVNTDVNEVLSVDRSALSQEIRDQLAKFAQESGLGVEVTGVTLASIHPPIEIANIYQNVVSAGIQKKAAILAAEGSAMVSREQALADQQVSVNEAGIAKDQRTSQANAEVTEYNASIEAYRLDPEAYRLDRYLESVEKTMSGRKKYLLGRGVDESCLYSGFLQAPPTAPTKETPAAEDGGKEAQG